MSLSENPIFLTQKRLTHRAGVLAAILIAALLGLSLLAGLVAHRANLAAFGFESPQEAGKMFYAWVIGVEIVVLVLGGFSKISHTLADNRKAGLWDSNRLTPLQPAQIITGYWFGAPLREFYMGAVLAGIGLVIVVVAKLPVTLWLGTQVLILSTTLFFGLLAALAGMAVQQPQNAVVPVLLLFFLMPFSFEFPKVPIINYLLPIYGVANLFQPAQNTGSEHLTSEGWSGSPQIFGLSASPILLSLGLQFVIGIFLWRAAVRKTANPFRPLLLRWEALAIFALLVAVQHALVWGIWQGQFPTELESQPRFTESGVLLAAVHGGAMLVGLCILAFASPLPERVRVEALRIGSGNLRLVFGRSAVSLALALAGVAAAASLTQFIFSFKNGGGAWALAAANLFAFFLMFALLLEYCRLRFKHRALGFAALGLFVLCVLPFILAGVFANEALLKVSFLAPGTAALAKPDSDGLKYLVGWTAAHVGVVVLLFFAWRRGWNALLATSTPNPPAR